MLRQYLWRNKMPLSPLIACPFLLLSAALGSVAARQSSRIDSGWSRHTDPSGFVVDYPTGWSAQGSARGQVRIHSANGEAFVLSHPFTTTGNGRSDVWLARTVASIGELLPGARIL